MTDEQLFIIIKAIFYASFNVNYNNDSVEYFIEKTKKEYIDKINEQ